MENGLAYVPQGVEQTVPHYVGQYEHRAEHCITAPSGATAWWKTVPSGAWRTQSRGVYSRSSESELCDRAYRNVPGAVSKGFAEMPTTRKPCNLHMSQHFALWPWVTINSYTCHPTFNMSIQCIKALSATTNYTSYYTTKHKQATVMKIQY